MSAFSKTEKQNRIRYDLVEYAVLAFLMQEDWKSVAGETESDECKQARAELEVLLREIDVISRRIQATTVAMDDSGIDAATLKILARKLATDESVLNTLIGRRDALEANVERACRRCEVLYVPETMLELIACNMPEANEVRLRLRSQLRKAIERSAWYFTSLTSPISSCSPSSTSTECRDTPSSIATAKDQSR